MAREKKKKHKKEENTEDEVARRVPLLRPETRQSVWSVISFVVALLLFLSWAGKAGVFGTMTFTVFSLLFGKAFLVIPLSFLLAAISLLLNIHRRLIGRTFLGAVLFLCSVLGLSEIVLGEKTGGYVGYFIAASPLRFLDSIASILIFFALLIISILVLFNVSFVRRPRDNEVLDSEQEENPPTVSLVAAPPLEQLPLVREMNDKKIVSEERALEEEAGIIRERPRATRRVPISYVVPPLTLLETDRGKPSSGDIRANANIIQRTLQNFGIDVDMGEINIGPSVTQYTLKPAEGVKLSRITNLASNLGLALAAHPLRIEAPIPGRSLVGIEVPNKSIAFVGLQKLLTDLVSAKQEYVLGFALGRDVRGQAVFADLSRMPHALIAGSTGSGKSVTIHSLLMGLLFTNPPEMLRLILIDPKRVELMYYNNIPHLLSPVVTDAKKAIQALRWATGEMEKRYQQLEAAGCRDIISYNADSSQEDIMPYLVIIIDELADLMATWAREVEASIVRLSQMARAVGIHLVISTQRPSVEVITGLIKANITTRIALQVASQIDSRTILDMAGAEKLLGKGDMLYLPGDASKPRRIQGVYVSEEEVKRVTKYLREQESMEHTALDHVDIFTPTTHPAVSSSDEDADDALYDEARNMVVETGKASTSYLQRRLRLGYARAARLIDMLEERGVIGPGDGARPREILASSHDVSSQTLPKEEEFHDI